MLLRPLGRDRPATRNIIIIMIGGGKTDCQNISEARVDFPGPLIQRARVMQTLWSANDVGKTLHPSLVFRLIIRVKFKLVSPSNDSSHAWRWRAHDTMCMLLGCLEAGLGKGRYFHLIRVYFNYWPQSGLICFLLPWGRSPYLRLSLFKEKSLASPVNREHSIQQWIRV